MKKLFTLLTLALISIGSAWGETLPKPTEIGNTTIGKYSGTIIDTPTGTLDLATQVDFSMDDNGWIAFASRTGMAGKTWHNGDGANGGSTNWTVPDGVTAPFIGSTSGAQLERYTVQSGSRVHALRFTGAVKASFLGSYNAADRFMIVALYSFDGSTFTLIDVKGLSSSGVGELLFDGLNSATNYVAYVYGKNNSNSDFYEVALKGPLAVKTNPESANYATGGSADAMTAAALSGTTPYSYQWYSCADTEKTGASPISGATSATYTPSTSATGTFYYYCRITDSATPTPAYVETSVATITVATAAAPTIGIASSAASAVSKGTDVTLSATTTGSPDPDIQWYSNTVNNNTSGTPISGATEATYNPSTSTAGTTYYYAVATNASGSATSDVVSVVVNASNKCELTKAMFSNGFNGFIVLGTTENTITGYYMSGDATPTITSVEISENATYSITGSTLTVTAEDGTTTKEFSISTNAVTPTNEPNRTFNGTEDWVATGGAFFGAASEKLGWNINKNTEESSNKRISEGKNRIYFFVENATKIILYPSENNGNARNVDVTINDGTATSYTFPKYAANAKLEINTGEKAMVGITNKGSGDARFGSIEIVGLTSPVSIENISTASGKSYATYVTAHDLDFSSVSSSITAYKATSATASSVTVEEITEVPAGTPILVKTATPGANVDVPFATSDVAAIADNLLLAGDGQTEVGGGDDVYDYILSDGKFYHASPAGPVAVGKAYLHLDSNPAGARSLDIDFGGTTGISQMEDVRSKKDEVYYDLQGRRVLYPTKGLYIVNGKKVILK